MFAGITTVTKPSSLQTNLTQDGFVTVVMSMVCLQGGLFCYCGDHYGKHGMSEDCSVACLGDDNLLCGGFGSNYIYHVDGKCTTEMIRKICAVGQFCPVQHASIVHGQ